MLLYSRLIRWGSTHRLWLLASGIAFGLLPFLALCLYVQPSLDDFSTSSDALTYGIWGVQPYIFQHWSGRYFTNLFLFGANPLNYQWLEGVQLVAALGQLLRIAVLYIAIRILAAQQLRRREAIVLAAGLSLLYTALIPSRFSALYYFTDIVVYQAPAWLLVLIPLAVERWHRTPTLRQRIVWGILAILGTAAAAGSNELTLVLLGWVIAVAAGLSAYRRQWRSLQIWATLGAVLFVGGIVSVLAPGNTGRQQLDGGLVPATSVGEVAARLVVLLRYLFVEPSMLLTPILTLLLAPLAVRILPARPQGLHLPLLLGAAILVSGVVLGTVPYALMWARVPLIPRATNIIIWWWLLGWIVAAWASLPSAPTGAPIVPVAVRTLLGFVLLIVVLIPSGRAYLDLRYDAPEFARQWQQRFKMLQLAGRTPHTFLQVPPLPPLTNRFNFLPPDDLSTMPGFGVNTRLAAWFGVDSVQVMAPAQ
jgi:hypothetical protein